MINRDCMIGKKTKAARRMAGLLMTGTMAGSILAGAAGGLQVSAATWQDNADYIFDYLTQKLGYSEAAACGIMANIRCESTFNPHAWNAGGGSYGLCQWTGGRYGRLQNWCRSNGFDYTTIDGQLSYLEYELENHYPGVEQYLRSVENNSDGAYDAGQYYCYHFEAPASRGSVSVYRGGLAGGTFWESYRPAEWYKVDGVWHYILRDGSYHKQWLTIDDETFYLDDEGNRISGWRSIDGNRYYFDSDGVMVSGWQKIDGKSYYFAEDGSLVTGLAHSGDDWYLLNEYGSIKASADMEKFAPVWIASVQGIDDADSEAEALASAQENAQEGLVSDSSLPAAEMSFSTAENASGALTAFSTAESPDRTAAEQIAAGMIPFIIPQEEAEVSEEDNYSAVEALLLAAKGTMEDEGENAAPESAALAASAGTGETYTETEAGEMPDDSAEEDPAEKESEPVENADSISDDKVEQVVAKETEKAWESAAEGSTDTDRTLTEQSEESAAGRTAEKAENASTAVTEEKAENAAAAVTEEKTENAAAAVTEEKAENASAEATEEKAEKASEAAAEEKAQESSSDKEAEDEEEKPESESSESEDQTTEEVPEHVIPETLPTEDISLSEMESSRREKSGEEQQERILITLSEEIPPMPPKNIPVLVETLREKKILRAVTQSGLDITPEVTSEVLEVTMGAEKAVVALRAEFHGSSAEIIVDIPIEKED